MIELTVLIALASYRLWRLVAMDAITEPLRAPLVASDSRVAGWVLDLLGCAWCLGWWIAGGVSAAVALWQGWDVQSFILAWLASSAVVGFLGKLD